MESINKVIKSINNMATIERVIYQYRMPYALKVVESIGRSRNKDFVIDSKNKFVYENMIRWVHGDCDMKCIDPQTKQVIPGRLNAGIYIAGNVGTGKSWVLDIMSAYCSIDNVFFIVNGKRVKLQWKNIRTDAICSKYTEKGIIDYPKKISVIGFQDLGTDSEPIESMYMGNRISVLKQILEHRGDHTDQITLITSNLPMNHQRLIDRYGDRVSSRLNEMCNYFELNGKDRRKTN